MTTKQPKKMSAKTKRQLEFKYRNADLTKQAASRLNRFTLKRTCEQQMAMILTIYQMRYDEDLDLSAITPITDEEIQETMSGLKIEKTSHV